MLDHLHKAKQYLWAFVEIGFLTILSVILIYLILGPDSSGVYVSTVADNVLKFANAVPAQSLVGLAIVLALVVLLSRRMREATPVHEAPPARKSPPAPKSKQSAPPPTDPI
jgi:nitrate reductase gamma subunit